MEYRALLGLFSEGRNEAKTPVLYLDSNVWKWDLSSLAPDALCAERI